MQGVINPILLLIAVKDLSASLPKFGSNENTNLMCAFYYKQMVSEVNSAKTFKYRELHNINFVRFSGMV